MTDLLSVEGLELVIRIEKTAEDIERLAPRLEQLRTQLHLDIQEAAKQGVPVSTLSRVAGLSRARVYELLKRPPKKD